MWIPNMNNLEQLRAVAARLSMQDLSRPVCPRCGHGRLDLIEERPHAIYGALGVTWKTLKCDAADCGAVTVE